MTKPSAKISITTACTPWLSLDALIPLLAQVGFGGVEIGLTRRSLDSTSPVSFWGNNRAMLDWATAREEASALRLLCDAHRLPCCGIAAYVEAGNRELASLAIDVGSILGASFVRVRAPWYQPGDDYRALLTEARQHFRELAAQAADAELSVVVEIHDRSICPTASAAMRLLEDLDPRHAGAIFDPGNYLTEGLEAIPMAIDLLGPYLHHVHVKDRKVTRTAQPNQRATFIDGENAPLGTGDLHWPGIAAALHAHGYHGWWSSENFTGLDQAPTDRLQGDLAFLQKLLTIPLNGAPAAG